MAQLEDIDKYIDEWSRTQIQIWREKIERMGIVRTGRLHESFSATVTHASSGAEMTSSTLRFMQYGIYQALGVGYGYTRNNGGDLPFLNKEYRERHGLNKARKVGPAWGGYETSGKPRKARDWYSKKLYMSVMAAVEDLARILGENAAHAVCEQLTDIRSALS